MKRILVIDDEEWLREMVHLALSQRGYEVLEAGNGVSGFTLDPSIGASDEHGASIGAERGYGVGVG